jgi:putative glutamine amidotransferase
MKLIFITQRVVIRNEISEIWDALDTKWSNLFLNNNWLPIIIPNDYPINHFFTKFTPDGIILTGGNDLSNGENFFLTKRDETESLLIEYAIEKNIPLLGVCRGMQMINHFFGGDLKPVDNHVKKNHSIKIISDNSLFGTDEKTIISNSFHNFQISKLGNDLSIAGYTEDNCIEIIEHIKFKIYGIMWHPEREMPSFEYNQRLLKKIF